MSDDQKLPLDGRAALSALQAHTPARIALGRAGAGQRTQTHLTFQLDHARARDAVHDALPVTELAQTLTARGWPVLTARSRATTRTDYLRRPDLGRRLDAASTEALSVPRVPSDVAIVLADGLSATAVTANAVPLLDELGPALTGNWSLAPIVLVEQGRVAIGDDIAEHLGCQLVIMLIGERPGLSAADSLGCYVTWSPRVGTIDANRHCISNIRPGGLSASDAARQIHAVVANAFRHEVTGVRLNTVLSAASRPLVT
ncbi:MAG: ethanolamine ammonia-lyase subunit EutC [Beijerinckiaceae bacterium]|nr:ethanolamine ammonia-lyase subunit EutC [Beijerinckiaceae bacterium]